ncbi:hypothetical protein GCM10028807_21150 [Spirosoma daeguense]
MTKPLHLFYFFLLIVFGLMPLARVMAQSPARTTIVDYEYERYKKRGDDFFKEGRYQEARRQYLNCLEVPGFEKDQYANAQINECKTGLTLRQQADDALRLGKRKEAIPILGQLLNLNPDDVLTRGQLADYYERDGNQLFNQRQYVAAKASYQEALKYATTKRETLLIQIGTIDEILNPKPSKRIGLKIAAGVVAVGASAYALMLRNDYQTKLATLNRISAAADPTGSGQIDTEQMYLQYDNAYVAAEAARSKNGLFKACIGVAAVAVLAEAYLLIHKPQSATNAFYWKPSSESAGLAIGYKF